MINVSSFILQHLTDLLNWVFFYLQSRPWNDDLLLKYILLKLFSFPKPLKTYFLHKDVSTILSASLIPYCAWPLTNTYLMSLIGLLLRRIVIPFRKLIPHIFTLNKEKCFNMAKKKTDISLIFDVSAIFWSKWAP